MIEIKNEIFLGIDPGLNVFSLVFIGKKKNLLGIGSIIPEDKLSQEEKGLFIQDNLKRYLDFYNPVYVCLEGISVRSLSRSSSVLCGIDFMVKMELANRSLDGKLNYSIISPAELKKFALGKGLGEKKEILDAVENNWKYRFPPNEHHFADAFVLAVMAFEKYSCLKKE